MQTGHPTKRLAWVTLLLIAVAVPRLDAQTPATPRFEAETPAVPRLGVETPAAALPTREQAIAYITSHYRTFAAGVGFETARLGEPMRDLRERWGTPQAAQRSGIRNNIIEYQYQPDPNTVLVFRGKNTLSRITISGSQHSLTHSITGAFFGMTRNTIQQLYFNQQPKQKAARLEYPELGINFLFEQDQLYRMEVYLVER